MGDKGRQDLRKADTPSNKGNKKETMGDKGRQDPLDGGHPSNKGKQEGVQWETKGGKTLGKADAPSNKGKQEGVQVETKGDKDTTCKKGKQEGRQWETIGDKTSGRRKHCPTAKGNKKGYNGRQGETRPQEGARKAPRRGAMGDKGRQMERQRKTRPVKRPTHHRTKGDKKGHNGKQREARPSGMRTHRPTKGNKKGYNWETKAGKTLEKGGHTILQKATRRGAMGD